MLPTGILKHTSVFKKISLVLALSIYLQAYADNSLSSVSPDTYFIVTGYYSPIEGQESYITGSFSGDKRLNGNGTNSASGNEILTGVLAAPSTYPFGTKIYFQDYGIGVVEDRGGAIVEAGVRGHEYDRIDVWMGYGDAGRIRAINWGVRKVKGKIVDVNEEPTLRLTQGIKDTFSDIRVSPDSTPEDIQKLQSFLKSINEYTGPISGNYSDVEQPLINFQIKLGIVKDKEGWGAGYFGPKTIEQIKMSYGLGNGLLQEEGTLGEKEKNVMNAVIERIHQKLEKMKDEKQRKKATEELLEEIDRILKKSANSTLNLKLKYFKENF